MRMLTDDRKLLFSRYTPIGLLRLLTNTSVMGDQTLTLRKAWNVYDRWLEDPCKVEVSQTGLSEWAEPSSHS